jgi:hypothetical protein
VIVNDPFEHCKRDLAIFLFFSEVRQFAARLKRFRIRPAKPSAPIAMAEEPSLMATFYLLPPRPILEESFGRFLSTWLPGLRGPVVS